MPMKRGQAVKVCFWSRAGKNRRDPRLRQAASTGSRVLCLEPEGRFYVGRLHVPASGTVVLSVWSPRPLRVWAGGALVLDEGLSWRLYQRELRTAIVLPCEAGEEELLIEVGRRPSHPESIDRDCPSRNRRRVMKALQTLRPDRLEIQGKVFAGATLSGLSLRFQPSQFMRDGVTYQHVYARPITGMSSSAPSVDYYPPIEDPPAERARLRSSVLPNAVLDGSTPSEKERGLWHCHVPVLEPGQSAPAVRTFGPDRRVEPVVEVAGKAVLAVESSGGRVTVPMPVFEGLGRLAPKREFQDIAWPAFAEAKGRLPEPVLPAKYAWMSELYYAAWEMLFRLVRHPAADSGLPGPYISTGTNFRHHQFVWDTSFTAMATAYGHRVMPYTCSMDLLYSRQFDGGYIHREHDVRDGLPALYEPDFSPNPPIMSVAEWAMYGMTGDLLRMRRVYPAARANHLWLRHNRRLPDGTYWTTGLANGLDNSPSLGDGYPCLTAQMAHDAEILGKMAAALGLTGEAKEWETEQRAIGAALNAKLWSDSMQIYSTSLHGGGHNTNKVVTAFWPLWAGVVPETRVQALAMHLKDPASFWRHHPIPSLAADSPHFQPAGNYWLGSTWCPTNFAAIKGFDRAGRHDLAVETTLRHLRCMHEVLKDTGFIWENYCSEESKKGSWSMQDYCWSSAGPIALLFEVMIGLQADAPRRTLRWRLPANESMGVRRLALGSATVTAVFNPDPKGAFVDVETDESITLELASGGRTKRHSCRPGWQRIPV